jgi:hypothetical protein
MSTSNHVKIKSTTNHVKITLQYGAMTLKITLQNNITIFYHDNTKLHTKLQTKLHTKLHTKLCTYLENYIQNYVHRKLHTKLCTYQITYKIMYIPNYDICTKLHKNYIKKLNYNFPP